MNIFIFDSVRTEHNKHHDMSANFRNLDSDIFTNTFGDHGLLSFKILFSSNFYERRIVITISSEMLQLFIFFTDGGSSSSSRSSEMGRRGK